jgi:molecular chaperone GrpE (heat shock protein)
VRPTWADELLEGLQKQSRTLVKQGARLDASLGALDARVGALHDVLKASPASAAPTAIRLDDVFDALDALDEARRLVDEPHLSVGLSRVSERLCRFCERAGYTRLAPVGELPDARLLRVVGTEHDTGIGTGRITRVVRAAIVAGTTLVREGEAILSQESGTDDQRLGH